MDPRHHPFPLDPHRDLDIHPSAAIHPDSDGSDNDPTLAHHHNSNGPPSKKKKGQRFFCTDFPPCNLSFTRSEHLARHIRKHTGERPFQCHCSRRFSRLDNLRQHAQTVHVNEDIPGDSLAATGTRFQRQIRTDRVRPSGGGSSRSRAGTAGSQGSGTTGGHSRGHSRNLSSSSITSTTSSFSQPEIRRRPPPLMVATNDRPSRLATTADSITDAAGPSTPPSQIQGLTAAGSPYTAFTSPHFSSPGYWDGPGAPVRRLSVPSAPNPFAQQHPLAAGSYAPPPSYVGPYSGPGVFASPASSQRSSDIATNISAAEAEMRRRTWHPSSSQSSSSLSRQVSNTGIVPAEQVQPASSFGAGGAEPTTRLPGIESFDKILTQPRPLTPPTRARTPVDMDNSSSSLNRRFQYSQQPSVVRPISGPTHRRGNLSLDSTLQRNISGLQLKDKSDPPTQWGQQTIAEIQSIPYQSSQQQVRPSSEDSSSSEGAPTPSTASLEYHPAIVRSNTGGGSGGYPDSSGMGRLEALVAVATRENQNAKLVT